MAECMTLTQNLEEQIELLDNSIERLECSLLEHGRPWPNGNSCQLSWPRFPCYGRHAKPNVGLWQNLFCKTLI